MMSIIEYALDVSNLHHLLWKTESDLCEPRSTLSFHADVEEIHWPLHVNLEFEP